MGSFNKSLRICFVLGVMATLLISGCTLFQDETDKKLSECDRYLSSPTSYSSCYTAVATDTAKTNPKRATGMCEQMKKTIETRLKQANSANDIYWAFSEGTSSRLYDTCITQVLQAKTKK